MKHIIYIFFAFHILVGSLAPSMTWFEFEKIPNMLDHFQLHKSETNHDVSFSDFISLHYNLNTSHDDPVHESELPFHAQFSSQLLFLRDGTDLEVNSCWTILMEFASEYVVTYEFQYSRNILHPPKV